MWTGLSYFTSGVKTVLITQSAEITTSADFTGGSLGRRKGGDTLSKGNARSPGMVRTSAPEGKLAELPDGRIKLNF